MSKTNENLNAEILQEQKINETFKELVTKNVSREYQDAILAQLNDPNLWKLIGCPKNQAVAEKLLTPLTTTIETKGKLESVFRALITETNNLLEQQKPLDQELKALTERAKGILKPMDTSSAGFTQEQTQSITQPTPHPL